MCIRDRYETFPVWNLPLKHPVNIAYEAATVDLDDVNTIDPFHLEAYGETTVNYNRDVETVSYTHLLDDPGRDAAGPAARPHPGARRRACAHQA